jgi:hypothetical protein
MGALKGVEMLRSRVLDAVPLVLAALIFAVTILTGLVR